MLIQTLALAWMFASAPIDSHAIVDADDPSNAERYASYKRVLIHGAIDPDVIERAKTLLTLPLGDERVILVNEKPYAFRLERHYHPPEFAGGPTGWHKGVTVYALVAEQ